MSDLFGDIAVFQVTDDLFSVKRIDGWKAIIVCVTGGSSAYATFTSYATETIGGKTLTPITIPLGGKFQYVCGESDWIGDIDIMGYSGCTLKIALSRNVLENMNEMLLNLDTL